MSVVAQDISHQNSSDFDAPAPAVESEASQAKPASQFSAVLHGRDFRLLWVGEAISLLGDQFYMIALPWLVLQLTGDALAMGAILALGGIPRALFMLVGGAVTDRFTPRSVMLVSNLLRMVLVSILAGIVMAGAVELWMLFAFALLFGLADAFFFPAQSAIIPGLVEKGHLETANAIMQGTMRLSLFAGPALAGGLIALLGSASSASGSGAAPQMSGIGAAFAFDALTFLASALTLWRIRPIQVSRDTQSGNTGSLLSAIRQGLVYVWQHLSLRTVFLLIGIGTFLINGPVAVGIPVLADTRFAEGAAAFGIIMSAFGGGSLAGILLAGSLPSPSPRRLGLVLGATWSGLGLGVLLLGLASTTTTATLVALVMGLSNGYVVILFIAWLQRNTPAAMLGRMMSLLMFAETGLMPVSMAVTGALVGLSATWLFVAAGGLMMLFVLLSILNPALRDMGLVELRPSGVAAD
jgi:MFS family permease